MDSAGREWLLIASSRTRIRKHLDPYLWADVPVWPAGSVAVLLCAPEKAGESLPFLLPLKNML